jgi:outer membrane lipoprotein SlyB
MSHPWQIRDDGHGAAGTRAPGLALTLAALLGLAGCATPAAPTPAATELQRPAATYGVVVSRRPIQAPTGNDIRGSILGAVGNRLPAGTATTAACEFIVREDNGQTVSVVQTDEVGLRPGDRVVLSVGSRAHLSRAAD